MKSRNNRKNNRLDIYVGKCTPELRLLSMVAVSLLDVGSGQVIAIINLRERIKTVWRRLFIIQHSQMSQAIITITTRQTFDILSYVIEIESHWVEQYFLKLELKLKIKFSSLTQDYCRPTQYNNNIM